MKKYAKAHGCDKKIVHNIPVKEVAILLRGW